MSLTDGEGAQERLTRLLSSLARTYHNGDDTPDVRLLDGDATPHAAMDGEYVAVNPNVRDTYGRDLPAGAELKVVADTLAHEIEHINKSDLEGKKDAQERHPDMPQVAGMVANILEDCHIDYTRVRRNPGQASAHKTKVDAIMSNHHRRPRVDNMDDGPRKLIEAFLQSAFAGYVKGAENMDDGAPTFEFVREVMPQVEAMRDTDITQDGRADAVDTVMDAFRRHAPDGTTGRDMDDAAGDADMSHTDEPVPSNQIDPADMDRDSELEPRDDGGADDGAQDAQDDGPDMDDLDDLDPDDFDGMDDGGAQQDTQDMDDAQDAQDDAQDAQDDGAGDGVAQDDGVACPDCAGHNVRLVGGDE